MVPFLRSLYYLQFKYEGRILWALRKNKVNSLVFFINNPDPNPRSGSEINAKAGYECEINAKAKPESGSEKKKKIGSTTLDIQMRRR